MRRSPEAAGGRSVGALLALLALGPARPAPRPQEAPTCWSFELPAAPAGRQAFPSLRLGPDGTVTLHRGSGAGNWRATGDSLLVASTSGGQPWALVVRAKGIPSATLRHGVGDPHAPEPPIELAARPVACGTLDRDPVESTPPDVPPRLLDAEEIDAALRREPDHGSGVRRSALVRFRVDAKGRAAEAALEQTSGDPAVDEAALRLAALARFAPATRGTAPVEAWTALWFHLR